MPTRVASAQLNQIIGDFDGNARRIADAARPKSQRILSFSFYKFSLSHSFSNFSLSSRSLSPPARSVDATAVPCLAR